MEGKTSLIPLARFVEIKSNNLEETLVEGVQNDPHTHIKENCRKYKVIILWKLKSISDGDTHENVIF